MAYDTLASSPAIAASRGRTRPLSGFASGTAAILGVLAFGALLWAIAPESGSRIDTLKQLVEWTPALAHGFSLNILISLGAVAIGTVAGVVAGAIALSRSFAGRVARWLIQAFRNAPWLVLIYFTTYVFPFEFTVFGKTLPFPDWLKVTLALALPAAANIAEIFRGAVASTPTTQWEAAQSLAFSRLQVLVHIVLPQCARRMLPPWTNVYSIITMGTALSSLVGIHDLIDTAQIASSTVARSSFTVLTYVATLVVFFAYCYPISRFTRWLERRVTSSA
ncbi:amino acid ABC transporter [Burkholderia sp. SFA1]|uniref:amino acid ABC transporter permease n=1 Tax=Caballeronia sp. CLC5 TaxID=2906764 RepID=UPI001EEBE477|nr:ABC transporter permease subunit [Caballeronia sp. CLC5]MCE4573535.1 ABC transporter permease subunit [Caballeronia sp. CLC5]BBQ00378.1 amino acid ABC transporter [Burkholderia sp. SFA1]